MTKVKAVKGLGWSCGAVSNSEWTGVRLRDVLQHAGVDVNNPEGTGIEHVQFEGEIQLPAWEYHMISGALFFADFQLLTVSMRY